MRITIEIPHGLVERAEAENLTVEEYTERVVVQAAKDSMLEHSRVRSLAELRAALDRLARHSEKIPSLPLEAL
ncbi:MAG: hypothetical protein ABI693_30315, partial [Bryobacteraceae bacterium]